MTIWAHLPKRYSAYHQIVTIKISKNRKYLVDNFRKFPKKMVKRKYLMVGTVLFLDYNKTKKEKKC